MASCKVYEIPSGGFNFENCLRNAYLTSKGVVPSVKVKKTGTTIVGITYKDGVILGADTRATSDTIVVDKNCTKIHYLAENMYCCGAGTAADTNQTCSMVSSQLQLHRLATDRVVPVCTANRLLKQFLFKYQGHIGAALVLGGVDSNGPHLYSIHPHGSTDNLPFTSMGSGSLAAIAVLETGWKPNLTLAEGKLLIRNAICGGIFNDLGSGSNVDMCIISKDQSGKISKDYIRPYEVANIKGVRQNKYNYKPGSTAILSSQVIPIEVEETVVRRVPTDEEMDVSA